MKPWIGQLALFAELPEVDARRPAGSNRAGTAECDRAAFMRVGEKTQCLRHLFPAWRAREAELERRRRRVRAAKETE